MPSRSSTPDAAADRIVDVDVRDEMQDSFLEYAYSVIYARALPDARDGMKPVQRRILYQAGEMGLRPDRGHVKSARLVGEVMGRLHPHGESAIYDALVRMAQPFSLRVPFIDGHGNFGSLDDGPAAMRYTECRLAEAALAMIASVHEDTVDFVANYDGREEEPTVLPGLIPALLVNGATGIAVGMATNMAPHNLGEVIGAARHLIANPGAETDDLMRFVPGPDLPSGGQITGLDGIRDAYRTGRGSFRMRAAVTVEQVSARRRGLVVTALPYNVGVERVMQRIKDLHNSKKITGIANMTDLTDGSQGLQLVIEVKAGIDPHALLEQLYRLTPLEEQFNINAVALVNGVPETLSLKACLEVFLDHRREVVRRRSEYRRSRAQERLHLVEGLLTAIVDIDEVIQVIRSSDNATIAKARLIDIFDLSDVQATYILDMPLRRLTKFSRIELEAERDELHTSIGELTTILEDPQVLADLISQELSDVAREHGTPRRTVLLESEGQMPAPSDQLSLEVTDEPCLVALDATGLIARLPVPEESDQSHSPDQGRAAAHTAVVASVAATTRSDVGVLTSAGRVLRLSVVELPGLPATVGPVSVTGGAAITHFVELAAGEQPVGLLPLTDAVSALATRQGTVKRIVGGAWGNKDEWQVIPPRPSDEVVFGAACRDDDQLVFVTAGAQLLAFGADNVRPQGLAAGGVAGIKLAEDDRVVAFAVAESESLVATVSSDGREHFAKITPLANYPTKGRATGGVRCQRLRRGETGLMLAAVGTDPRACDASGQEVELPTPDERRDAAGVEVSGALAHLAPGVRPPRPAST